MKVSLKLAQN